MSGNRLILGIESSCDETAAAVLSEDGLVLSNVISSQISIHEVYGGVVPEIAARAHLEHLPAVIEEALETANIRWEDLACVSSTMGPGLLGCLLVGLSAAKAIATRLDVPFLGVDHIEGHLLSPAMGADDFEYPFLGLVVSGGHSCLYEVSEPGRYRLIGQTRDDAAGEAFDKVAKFMMLGYPGGKLIDDRAKLGDATAFSFPRASMRTMGYDFSFSGLKSAVLRHWEKSAELHEDTEFVNNTCASFQRAVVDVLLDRVRAFCRESGIQHVGVSGGVALNTELRNRMQDFGKKEGVKISLTDRRYCADNAAMIAYAALRRFRDGQRDPVSLNAFASGRQVGYEPIA
jgi:N6-L-threonylcarbamoyladenine synthase